jgi:hypothetical protein
MDVEPDCPLWLMKSFAEKPNWWWDRLTEQEKIAYLVELRDLATKMLDELGD